MVPSATTRCRRGWLLREVGQQHGHEPAGRGADHADPDVPGHRLAQRPHVGDEGVELAQDPVGPGHDDLPSAVSRPADRSTSVVPSSRSSRATWAEMLDWTVPRCVGGDRERPVLRDRHQRLQVSEFHRF